METKETIISEVNALFKEGEEIYENAKQKDKDPNFDFQYHRWYMKALPIVKILDPDRYNEFREYYEINPKRKLLVFNTCVIQDYLLRNELSSNDYLSHIFASQSTYTKALICFGNQLNYICSITSRIDSILTQIDNLLLNDILDSELDVATRLLKINIRAAGAVAGVVLEGHLKVLCKSKGITFAKKDPVLGDYNQALYDNKIYDDSKFKRILYLGSIRNLCDHKKDKEPTKEQVVELIQGAEWAIKNVF